MFKKGNLVFAVFLFVLQGPVCALQSETRNSATADLVEKAEAFRQALRDELVNLQERRDKLGQRLTLFRGLYQEGLVSRVELDELEAEWTLAEDTLARREAELARLADLIAEARLLASTGQDPEPAMELYPGRAVWTR